RSGDRVDRALPLAVPLDARLGEAGCDESLGLGVDVAVRSGPEVFERHAHLDGQLVRRVLAQRQQGEQPEGGRRQLSLLTFALDRSIHCSCQEYTREALMEQAELRVATIDDAPTVESLMKESIAALFPQYYDARQSASAVDHVAVVDEQLLADGTYFVLEHGDELVSCGGGGRPARRFTGRGGARGDHPRPPPP